MCKCIAIVVFAYIGWMGVVVDCGLQTESLFWQNLKVLGSKSHIGTSGGGGGGPLELMFAE